MTLTLYTHRSGLHHITPRGHIERAERLETILDLFSSAPFNTLACITDAAPATDEQIFRAHDPRYIAALETAVPDSGLVQLDGGDTFLSPGSWAAALDAAGAVCRAVDDIASGNTLRAFCAVRPPGHHAEYGEAMGFCLLNTIFIGALHAQKFHRIEKIAIVDFDVHHGNGSDTMARAHEGVFFVSSHQSPLYPGTGDPSGDIPGRILNVPLNHGDGGAQFRAAYTQKILPALRAYAPDLLMISAGFDAYDGDPSAGLCLYEEDFAWVTQQLRAVAEETCGGKMISVLEGGYDLPSLKKSVAAHCTALL